MGKVLLTVIALLGVGCGEGNQPSGPGPSDSNQGPIEASPGEPTTLARAKRVHREHTEAIFSFPGAQGHGIGLADGMTRADGEPYVIVVYLETPSDRPDSDYSLRGIELDFMVTGQFEAH